MYSQGKFRKRSRKLVKKVGRYLLNKSNRVLQQQSLISNDPVLDNAVFDWIPELENQWETIRNELDEILESRDRIPAFHELSTGQKRISKGDNWKTFVFSVLGDRYRPNCERCPRTARLLNRIPAIRNAWFSIISPRYHIPAHEGPSKGFVRIHLGLKIPAEKENCSIRVADRKFFWQEGKCVVFDDSYEHEVWNDTDEERVVLFIDVDRPMRLPGKLLHKFLVALSKKTIFIREVHQHLRQYEHRQAQPDKRQAA